MKQVGLFTDLTDKIIATNFSNFMTRCAMLEELIDAGERFLRGFHQELEMLKRTPLSQASVLVDDVIKANYTDRMKVYVDANYCNDARSIINLHSCKLGLEDHLLKAKVLLDELENLKSNAAHTTNLSMDKFISNLSLKDSEYIEGNYSHLIEEDSEEIFPLFELPNRTILMVLIFDMLKLDFTMQERIVGALRLDTPLSELESYCIMWSLRPYVKVRLIQQAWRCVKAPKELDSV